MAERSVEVRAGVKEEVGSVEEVVEGVREEGVLEEGAGGMGEEEEEEEEGGAFEEPPLRLRSARGPVGTFW